MSPQKQNDSAHYIRELKDIINAALRRCEALVQEATRSPSKKQQALARDYDSIHHKIFMAKQELTALLREDIS